MQSFRRYGLTLLFTLTAASPGAADWSVDATGRLFYTDDVALFSATRRLNLHGDPTQPALDTSLTGQGSDMVFEPDLTVTKSFSPKWGKTDLSVHAQGFVYAINPPFNHASVGVQLLQEITPRTRIRLRYYTAPNLLLGNNESRQTESIQEERVTSHIASLRLEQRLSERWEVRILTRYGVRLYNQAFSERDTTFWTIGPHIVWHLTHRVALLLGYHYERGLADGREQPQFKDDVSYVNNYVSLGLEAELMERLSLELGAHFERNDWTSGIVGDERKDGHETVVQGEITFQYRLTDKLALLCGFQRSQRKQSFEPETVHNTNAFLGASYVF